ncbi:MAG: hypothetical protein ACK4N5_06360, partial [Myxococcales bacterium]
VLAAQLWRRRWPLLAATPLLFYGLAVRHEGALTVLPVCVWAGLVLAALPERPRWVSGRLRGAATGLLLFAALVVVNGALVRAMTTRTERRFPEQVVLIYDLAYLSVLTNEWLMPAHLSSAAPPPDQLANLRTFFEKYACHVRYCIPLKEELYPEDPLEANNTLLRKKWWREVRRHFGAYVKMKATVFIFNYSFGTEAAAYSFHHGVDQNDLGVTLRKSALNDGVMALLRSVANSPLFRPWYYVLAVLLLALGVLATTRSLLHPAMLLAVSALAKESIYLLWWSGYDFRYHWWTVFCVFLIPLVALALRRERAQVPA